jgi:hypothetical protein
MDSLMVRKRSTEEGGSLFAATAREAQPLAARMRPTTLDEFVGQEHLLAPGKPLREAIERGVPGSMIFWGPPGSGKTTLAHLVASTSQRVFVPFSAVTEGVPRIREIVTAARGRLESGGAQTILFIDEIHRLNKAQQDSLLPPSEDGTLSVTPPRTPASRSTARCSRAPASSCFSRLPRMPSKRSSGGHWSTASGASAGSGWRWMTTRFARSPSRRTAMRGGRSPCSRPPRPTSAKAGG